jgi:hypothetical protein
MLQILSLSFGNSYRKAAAAKIKLNLKKNNSQKKKHNHS